VIGYPQPSSLSRSNAKEPLENASHVRNAVARFNQVKALRKRNVVPAWKRIQSAAKRYAVELEESASLNSARWMLAMAARVEALASGLLPVQPDVPGVNITLSVTE